MTLRIANGAGFWGDNLDAPRRLVEHAEIDCLTLEYLAELTMSILARMKEKDPQAGYAHDFIDVLRGLSPHLARRSQFHLVTNAGGMNPSACAQAAARVLHAAGLDNLLLAVVAGDDLLPRLHDLQQQGCSFAHLDTGQPLAELKRPVVSANAYVGAEPITRGLAAGARVVITGRVADASLTLGPAVHAFGWEWEHTDRLAGATVAGHLIECGAQATGGYLNRWEDLALADVGYPIAELDSSGDCVVTKPAGSGGRVDRHSVAAQLVYEIGDPAHYLTPDVDVDFTTVEIEEQGADRVAVRGATGGPKPENLKVSLAYRAGYQTAGQLVVAGRRAVRKALAAAEMILARLQRAGSEPEEIFVECLGTGAAVPGRPGAVAVGAKRSDWGPTLTERVGPETLAPHEHLREVVLRIAARDADAAVLERFGREFAPLATSGPAGLAGYTTARGTVRPVFAYWPTLIPREFLQPTVTVRSVHDWCAQG